MRKTTFHLLATLAISAALLTACAPQTVEVVKTVEVPKEVEVEKTVVVEVEKEAEGPLTVVLIPKSVGHPFWGDLEKGMHAQAVELGVQSIFHGPELALAEGQIDLFETYLNMGVDAIGMAPNDPATVPPLVEAAEDAGVFFLTFDTDAPESGRSMYIGTDNVVGGEQGAEAMIELLEGEGKVAIVTGGLTALNLNQRIEGFKEAAAEYPDLEIVDTVAHGDALETGVPLIVDLLTAHPDLKGIYAVSGPNIVVEALQEQGYEPGEIIVFGFDIFEPIPTLMREGWIQGTVAQRPYMEGKLVVQWMNDIVTGAAEIPDPPFVDTGTNVVLPENLDEYLSVPH
jgi:ribose transport system substrate-binding protein